MNAAAIQSVASTHNWNAYANEKVEVAPTGNGQLNGLTFAIKDVFSIKGIVSGAGNPDWLRTHEAGDRHAAVIGRLLGNGARLRGTTITDELMYSINGENAHYGTPSNPNATGRIPGGSSSGSAVAVAAGLADFAIGTDTGGSVRVPAAYCGVFGIRPTHGAVSVEGLIPLAPSFDTVGWMARDAGTLLSVGDVLLDQEQQNIQKQPFTRLIIAEDMWDLADNDTKTAFTAYLQALKVMISDHETAIVAEDGLQTWMGAFRHIQGIEIWRAHGDWITEAKPAFGPGVAERFAWAASLRPEEHANAYAIRANAIKRMEQLLDSDTIMAVPSVPGCAPFLNGTGEEVERRRSQTLQLSCVAGLSGLPQVTMPIAGESGLPIGLSFIAGRNQDIRLLQWLQRVRSFSGC